MKKTLLLILLLICYNIPFFGQSNDLPIVIKPSPTVAGLMHFEEVPVNYYTGQPDINIPLFSKKLGKNLALDLSLRYSTLGVRVNERSGWVGTGWNLEAGGVISRTVRGVPDEMEKSNIQNNRTGVLHLDEFWSFSSGIPTDLSEYLWNAGGTSTDKYDTELDLYQFSILGKTGRFVIIKENNNLVPKLLSKNENFKIELDYDPSSFNIDSFTVIDANGYVYTFSEKEMSKITSIGAKKYYASGSEGVFNSYTTENFIPKAWHLSKIEASNQKELIFFEYEEINHESYLKDVNYLSRSIDGYTLQEYRELLTPSTSAGVLPKTEYSFVYEELKSQKLKKIIFKEGNIEFIHRTELHPETNGVILGSIVINNSSNSEIKSYELEYDTIVEENRLWLMSVNERFGNKVNVYELEYNEKSLLSSFNDWSDNWGYNTFLRGTGCGAVASTSAIQYGLLNKIKYPTGGEKEFIFEHNTITYQGENTLTDDEYAVMNPDNRDIAPIRLQFNNDLHNSLSVNYSTLTFEIAESQQIDYDIRNLNVSNNGSNTDVQTILDNIAIKLLGPTGIESTINFNRDNGSIFLEAGVYSAYLADLAYFDMNPTLTFDLDFCMAERKNTLLRYINGGGVRIKEILFNEHLNADSPATKTMFTYEEPYSVLGNNYSYGSVDGKISGLTENYYRNKRALVYGGGCYNNILIKYKVTSKSGNVELTKGQYVGYKKVKVAKENNGYFEYIYTSSQDYFNAPSVFTYPYAPSLNLDYKRGLLLNKNVYDEGNNLKIKETNTYQFQSDRISHNWSRPYQIDFVYKEYCDSFNSYLNQYPDVSSAPCNLSQCPPPSGGGGGGISSGGDHDFSFDNTFPNIWDAIDYVYTNGCSNFNLNGHSYTCEVIYQSSKGITSNDCSGFYPTEVPMSTYLLKNDIYSGWAKLKETNTTKYYNKIIGTPSEVTSKITYGYDDVNFQVNKQDMFYNEGGNPVHMESKYFFPTSSSSYPVANSSLLTGLNNINEVIGTETYKNGKRISSTRNMYREFSSNLVLPEIIQSSKGEVTPPAGGGPYDPLSNLEDRLTYHRYDEYGNPLEVSKKDGTKTSYIWGYNQTKPIAKIENASYAEIATALGVTETQLLAFNETNLAQINSLRVNLLKAMTSTYTYELLVGMTSSTDPRGYTTTYTYDEFNRLRLVQDNDMNPLSKNEYIYRTQN